jgi:type I restriction enzyme S subunit
MNAELLLAHYDRISDAPDAVAGLRKFILDLAVRGKLAEQDSNDEPASVMFARIIADHHRLKGSIAPIECSKTIQADEVPFTIPNNWRWVRLGERLELYNGRAFKPADWILKGLPIVRIQNLNNDNAPFNYCAESEVQPRHIINTGSFLISWSGTPGTSFGAFIWQRGAAALNQHIFTCFQRGETYFDRFLQLAINGRLDEMIAKAHGGVGLQHITKGKLEFLPLPLPPLAEQHRIVAKVDELMALCDRLAASQREQETRRAQLTASAHHHLNNGEDAGETRLHAQFFIDHLPRLTKRPDQIKQLRQTILNLAICGKLVPQTDTDEPVMDLLQRIQAEQKDLIRRRVIKGREYGTAFPAGAAFIEIPQTWQFVFLGKILTFGPQNGISPTASSRPEAPRSITLTATTSGTFKPEHFKQIEANIPADSEFWIRQGDLLFQRGNTREYVGMAAYYDGEPGQFLYPDLIIKVRPTKSVDLRYIHLCSTAPYARAYFGRNASGAQSTMPKINHDILVNLPIPLPPFAEQHRIVAKVDELMTLCYQLEASLSSAQTEACRLLESVLHAALNSDHRRIDQG